MGLLDALTGKREARPNVAAAGSEDEQAVRRYLYMLRTAPPEAIEQAHEEAFGRLTPAQRSAVLEQLRAAVPASEGGGDDPRSLARMATRAEVRQPGTLQRVLGGAGMGAGAGGGMGGGGMGMGGMLAGGLLSSLAGSFIGTALAQQFFSGHEDAGHADHGDDAGHHLADTDVEGHGARQEADAADSRHESALAGSQTDDAATDSRHDGDGDDDDLDDDGGDDSLFDADDGFDTEI